MRQPVVSNDRITSYVAWDALELQCVIVIICEVLSVIFGAEWTESSGLKILAVSVDNEMHCVVHHLTSLISSQPTLGEQ